MINNELQTYCQEQILPQYDNYDRGHNRDHILTVVDGVAEFAQSHDADCDMLYVAAIFHDLGLVHGRETHHLSSAQMLREDHFIQRFFSAEQIDIIAEAIEDHRASSKSAPRSIYGEILSSADRIIDPETIIKRCYFHNIAKYPDGSLDENLDKIYDHIVNKYGENGYLKVPILTRRNALGLSTLRSMLGDEASFRLKCIEVINNIKG